MKISVAATTALFLPTMASAFAPSSFSGKTSTKLAAEEEDLFSETPVVEKKIEMSPALPFVPRPKLLDGTMAGDVGFDPFNFAGADKASLIYMREAEIKHSRLAMLAVVGWPLAELFDKPLAEAIGKPILLTKTGASPSLLNGGLDNIDFAYWGAIIALAGYIELENDKAREEKGMAYVPGDCNFDPLGFFPKDKAGQLAMQTKELKHGRLAMLAILGFAAQEALYRTPVVAETPFFFHSPF